MSALQRGARCLRCAASCWPRRLPHLILAAFLAGLGTAQQVEAQPSAADSAAIVLGVAESFEAMGDAGTALRLYRHILAFFPGTPAAREVTALLAMTVPRGGGETELAVSSTLYGLWLGVAVPWALEASDQWAYGLGLVVGGPAGYLGSRAYAGDRSVSPGQARAIGWGGAWGSLQGLWWSQALGDPEDEDIVGAVIAGGAVGTALGLVLARGEVASGTATAANLGSLWGAWFGFAGAYLLDYRDGALWGSAAGVGNLALAGSAWAGHSLSISRSRGRLISLGGLVGGFAGLGTAMIIDSGNDDVLVGLPLAGSVAGLVTGMLLTRSDNGGEAAPGADARGAPSTGSLLNWVDGQFALSVPMPSPAWGLSPSNGVGKTPWTVPLLNLRF